MTLSLDKAEKEFTGWIKQYARLRRRYAFARIESFLRLPGYMKKQRAARAALGLAQRRLRELSSQILSGHIRENMWIHRMAHRILPPETLPPSKP